MLRYPGQGLSPHVAFRSVYFLNEPYFEYEIVYKEN